MQILIQNGHILTMDGQNTVNSPGWVLIDNGRIIGVGAGRPAAELNPDRVIDATHMAVLPGLVNAHTHLSQAFMRGLGDDKPLLTWLKQIMWPIQAAITPEDMRLASLLGLVENLRCGVTSVGQHHKITASVEHAEAVLKAAKTIGLRLNLYRGWVDVGGGSESPDGIVDEVQYLVKNWHGSAVGRIKIGFGPMAAWRCSDETMQRTADLAREWNIATHIHVAEAQDEIDLMQQRNGLRHIEWLHKLDVLGPDMQLVHCVKVTDAELDLIAESGAAVIHCPVSNMYLASGAAPVRKMLNRGIPVALGTDGSASHNSQDMLETLKTTALLAKVSSGNATELLPLDTLRMATTTGAKLFSEEARTRGSEEANVGLGQLVEGAKADVTLVDLNSARSMPVHHPESALVYNANGPDVHTVIVDGQILLDAGKVTMLDEEALLEECRVAATKLLERAGVDLERQSQLPMNK